MDPCGPATPRYSVSGEEGPEVEMRFFVGLVLVLAVAALACSETSGPGGSGAEGGMGGIAAGVSYYSLSYNNSSVYKGIVYI